MNRLEDIACSLLTAQSRILACISERLKGQSIQSQKRIVEPTKYVLHESPLVIPVEDKNRYGLFKKKLQRAFLSNGVNSSVIHWTPTEFLRILNQQKHCHLGPERTERME